MTVKPDRHPATDCLEHGESPCRGPVTYRPSPSTGMRIPRCDRHEADAEQRRADILDRYPDSPIPPAWFDPAAAGEHWDDDY